MDRRTFLKIAGIGSVAITAGCTSEADKTLFSLVHAPDDMVTGKAACYATTCRECPAGCGIIAKNREGRIIKIEGNPLHPINNGKLCMRGQSALQRVYHPDRIKTPLIKDKETWRPMSFSKALALLKNKVAGAAKKGPNRVRMLTEIEGESLLKLFAQSLEKWRSSGPLVFEPFAYESLKSANEKVFGLNGLVSYNLQDADLLVSFGADFLETWLSPVEYAQKFKDMHAQKNEGKHLFFHISPYQSLTAANADQWMPCAPGGETAVVLALINEVLKLGRGQHLTASFRSILVRTVSPYTRIDAARYSGMSGEHFQMLLSRLMESSMPLILGTGTGSSGGDDLQTNVAVNLLNLILEPELTLFDFVNRHRVEIAAKRSEVIDFFKALKEEPVEMLILNNINPAFSLPPETGVKDALKGKLPFVVSFTNIMDETAQHADLVFPVALPLETWGEYEGKTGIGSTLQPAMGKLTHAPDIGDVFLEIAFDHDPLVHNFKTYLFEYLVKRDGIRDQKDRLQLFRQGGTYNSRPSGRWGGAVSHAVTDVFDIKASLNSELVFVAAPSIRFFDGRGAHLPWLCEIPDPLTKVAWHTPVQMHPTTMAKNGLVQGDVVRIQSQWGQLEAPVYKSEGLRSNVLVMSIGQGHTAYGRYAQDMGLNPNVLLSPEIKNPLNGPEFNVHPVSIKKTGLSIKLAHTDGSRIQHNRKIALSVPLDMLKHAKSHEKYGLTMHDFPLTLPLPEGYDSKRDFYPPHDHKDYRWSMIVDLDRCIGCNACSAACYAENNLGVVGIERILRGREMSWLRVERYHDSEDMEKITFLPMMCQHCDNAPCESVCPVYAPHHSEEGLNNQIYNRCIGTRFCSQNCPYKVRRFNWFDWQWPEPMNLQLNPNVTVRSKGVMEKCSFCIQRIKEAHGIAKNENRMIKDGEVLPACVQTCPTGALYFGNLMDKKSRVRQLVKDPRAYQVMGYLNTKPAVIYLKKVVQNI
ncbi:MAG: 4Fe-4S dicluster domain-containing protein [Deltaproteobacteria bacterium]|jgi:molybdopterin-containing oxidoreductase family iron-sulfur binding subunit|nr:4Fe-4S dicluster domain-containing protein [Deltaproteobacteria bacterium]